ncbi:ABC transporter substrate-binding protein [Marinactinospora rubrisoli]|uniref:ABC transporter substrate-binding protein n=1 Tax=Marinactinospora rubrisoli TaxID=2715399 RepID=A0ABW2KKM5_9ACTN
MTVHRGAPAATLALALVLAAGCAAGDDVRAEDISDVTLRVGDQTGATRALLEEAGLLDDVPYEIEWSEYAAAVNLHEALKADAIDIGAAADAPTVSAIAGGSSISAVAAWSNDGKGTALLVPEDSAARSVADLRGADVSPTTRGSIGHYLLLEALREEGLSAGDVNASFLAPVDASTAFSSGSIDAWAIWGVYQARAVGELDARVLVDGEDLLPGYSVLSATEETLADPLRVQAIADYADRVDRAYAWGREDSDAYAEFYAEFSRQPVEIAREVGDSNTAYRRVPVDDAFAEELAAVHRTWVDGQVLPDRELDLTAHVTDVVDRAGDVG